MLNASTLCFSANQLTSIEKSSPAPLFQSRSLTIRRVTDHRDQLASDQLVRRMYAWRGYLTKRQFATSNDPDRATIAAWHDSELVATLTLTRDNGHSLLCESLYPDEVSGLRAKGLKICECSRLAVDQELSSRKILDVFFRTAYSFARSHFGSTDAVIEINPRHCRYYESELGFSRLGTARICPRVDAPAILLHRDFRQHLPKIWVSNIAA